MEIAYHPRTPQPPSPSAWDNFVIPEPSYVADGAGMGKRASGVTSPWVGVGQARSSNVGAVDGGIRHKQLGAAAAQRARDRADHKAIPGSHDPTAVAKSAASPYQKDMASRAAERAVRPWAPYGAGLGERRGALLAHLGPAAAVQTLAGEKEDQSALYEIAPAAAKAIGEAAGRVSINTYTGHSIRLFVLCMYHKHVDTAMPPDVVCHLPDPHPHDLYNVFIMISFSSDRSAWDGPNVRSRCMVSRAPWSRATIMAHRLDHAPPFLRGMQR